MSEKEQKRSGGLVALVVLLLIVTIVSAILATYAWAKYSTTKEANTVANVAKWNVSATTGDLAYTQKFTHVLNDGTTNTRIAPGTDGTITYGVDVLGTEVDVDYTISLVSVDVINASGTVITGTAIDGANAETDNTTHEVPTNLVIKNKAGAIIYENKAIKSGTNGVIESGRIPANSAASVAQFNHTFAWEWPYEKAEGDTTNDIQDTKDGRAAEKIRITYKIDYVQVKPTAP